MVAIPDGWAGAGLPEGGRRQVRSPQFEDWVRPGDRSRPSRFQQQTAHSQKVCDILLMKALASLLLS